MDAIPVHHVIFNEYKTFKRKIWPITDTYTCLKSVNGTVQVSD